MARSDHCPASEDHKHTVDPESLHYNRDDVDAKSWQVVFACLRCKRWGELRLGPADMFWAFLDPERASLRHLDSVSWDEERPSESDPEQSEEVTAEQEENLRALLDGLRERLTKVER
jgi:hypothetical protein